MKKFNLTVLLTSVALCVSVFSTQALADTQSHAKKMNRYDRECTPEKYTPKQATCNKEKMNSKYFISAVIKATNSLSNLSVPSTVNAVRKMLAEGANPAAIALALGETGKNSSQVEWYLEEAGYDVSQLNSKKQKRKKHHHFATNGGNSSDVDGQTVSCVKA